MDTAGAAKSLLPSIATDLVCKQVLQDKQTAMTSTADSGSASEAAAGVTSTSSRMAAFDEDAEDDLDMEDDPEYRKYKEKRLAELKAAKEQAMTNKTKGHGEYREIDESEFLPTVTKSHLVVCHFYHRDFERCKIVDEHFKKICIDHVEAKFVKINAEKALFFVGKLQVKVLPTIVCFVDGVAVDRLVGFEELGGRDDFPTLMLIRRLVQAKVLQVRKKAENPGFHVAKKKAKEESDEEYDQE